MVAAAARVQEELLTRFAGARTRTDRLFTLVRTLYARPIPERHRLIFYLGHLEAFDWNLLRPRLAGVPVFHAEFDRLFAFGIDPPEGKLPCDQESDWPSLAEVHRYNARVRETLDAALRDGPFRESEGEDGFPPSTILNVAIEHRLMHAETLAYLFHQLPIEHKIPEPAVAPPPVAGPAGFRMMDIPGGTATLGLTRDDNDAFGWDNEYHRFVLSVPPFAIDKYKVTNGQFLEFLECGGYDDTRFWTPEDWQWRSARGVAHPVFWRKAGDGWACRTMFGRIPLPLDWPVYVSHAEAAAYTRWARKRLPTEAEWHRAAYGTPQGVEGPYPWGGSPPGPEHGYFDAARWDPAPVHAFPQGDSAFGVSGLIGNGWEWTSSLFEPFPGFRPFPFYPGYSADFFDAHHYVLKGGSPSTDAVMLRRSFRNWFRPHYQYVYAGFRCVSA